MLTKNKINRTIEVLKELKKELKFEKVSLLKERKEIEAYQRDFMMEDVTCIIEVLQKRARKCKK